MYGGVTASESRFPVLASTSRTNSSSKNWRWMRGLGGAAVVCLAIAAGATAASAAPPHQQGQAGSATSTNQQEAVATYNALQQNFYSGHQSLYRGSPSNPCGTYSCLWPFTNTTAGTVYLYGAPNGARYATDVAARLTGLGHYFDPTEVSPTGAAQPPAYQSRRRRRSVRAVPPTTTTTRGPG